MSTTLEPPTIPADADLDVIAERVVDHTVVFAEHLTVWLGLELGLYASLQEGGAATPRELAARAGIDERYAREWLEQQTVAGNLVCLDPEAPADDRVFDLPSAVAAVLLDPRSGAYLAPLYEFARGVSTALDPVVTAYRTGGGVPYAAYGEAVRHGIGAMNGPTFDAQLAGWLQQLPDVEATLRAAEEPRILDLGCGVGRSSLALARAYPRASVRGVDLDPASIAEARAAAAAAGLADRVTFACVDAAQLRDDARYDLVTVFEALHDMGDPVGTLRAARSLLNDGGAVYVSDERVAHTFVPDETDVVERLQYAFSVLHCLPATMAEDPAIANGTVLRMPTLVEWARAAGFGGVQELDVDDPFWRHYRLDAGGRG
jgi:SAM-dependent methyltransferase